MHTANLVKDGNCLCRALGAGVAAKESLFLMSDRLAVEHQMGEWSSEEFT